MLNNFQTFKFYIAEFDKQLKKTFEWTFIMQRQLLINFLMEGVSRGSFINYVIMLMEGGRVWKIAIFDDARSKND